MAFALICMTGADGAGKTTQIELLEEHLQGKGFRVHRMWCRWKPFLPRPFLALAKRTVFRKKAVRDYNVEPGEGERFHAWQDQKRSVFRWGLVRWAYLTFAVTDYALQTWCKLVIGRLHGNIILADRYLGDLLIDQAINFGYPEERFAKMVKGLWMRVLPRADMVLYLDVPEEVAFQRRADIPSVDYLRIRRAFYQAMCRNLGYEQVAADRSVEDVHRDIVARLEASLPAVGR